MAKFKLTPVALALSLATSGAVMAAAQPSASGGIQEEVNVVPAKTISPSEEAVISSAGVKVLRHIAEARAKIKDKDAAAAKAELAQAEKLLDIIQEALPVTKVKDHIWVAKKHLEYEDTQEVLPDLIPIYASLDELVDVMPVAQAKQHLKNAEKQLKAGDKQKAKEALDATDAALQYTEIDLPLSATRVSVDQAKAYLDNDKLADAETALKTAEDSVVFMSVGVEEPLFSAKGLLWQGVLDYDAGNTDMAKADLQKAIGQLKNAAESDNKYTKEAAEQLLDQARQLEQDMGDNADTAARLHHLWESTQAFADRSLEYLSAGWARYRADSPVKSDLIEAKLHLTSAKIDLFTGDEADQARKELQTSEQYLGKAAEQAEKVDNDTVSQKIVEVRQTVQALSKDPFSADQNRYVQLVQELSGMIRSL